MYFTKRSRQKTKNSNFRNLYKRINEELKERQKTESYRKIRFSINDLDDDIHFDIKQTQIEEVIIPDFLNDHKNIPLHSNGNVSPSLSTTSFDEDTIREEIQRLKQQKFALLYEMHILKRNSFFIQNKKKEEKEKDKDKDKDKEKDKDKDKDKIIENDYSNVFCYNKNVDMNFDIEPNLFINSENNSDCTEKDKDEEEEYYGEFCI